MYATPRITEIMDELADLYQQRADTVAELGPGLAVVAYPRRSAVVERAPGDGRRLIISQRPDVRS
jgi:hypothetical protein